MFKKYILNYISNKKHIPLNELDLNSNIFYLEYFDSLDFYKFILSIETEFDISISINNIICLDELNLNSIIKFLEEKNFE